MMPKRGVIAVNYRMTRVTVDGKDMNQFELCPPETKIHDCTRIFLHYQPLTQVSAVLRLSVTPDGDDYLEKWEHTVMDTSIIIPKGTPVRFLKARDYLHLMLELAEGYHRPLTSLLAAPRLLPAISQMGLEEQKQFLIRIGMSDSDRKRKVILQKFYICSTWFEWESKPDGRKVTHREMVSQMNRDGMDITLANFEQIISGRGFEKLNEIEDFRFF